MSIRRVRLARLRAPLRTPFRTALREVSAAEDIVVIIDGDDGRSGYGSAAATAVITGDTHASIIAAIRGHIAPRLIGADIGDLGDVLDRVQGALHGNPSAKAAVDIALHDLWAQTYGAALYRLLGGGRPQLETDLTISLDGAGKMVLDAQDAVARGFRALKVKLGRDPAIDIKRVRAIHAAVPADVRLRLDANQGWTPKQAVRVMRTLEDDGLALDLLEQPVAAADLDGLKFVRDRIDTPVLADESAFGPLDVLEIIRRRAADLISIKLMKCGGIRNALRIADLAALHGVECLMSCMLESSIGAAAAAHVAVARAAIITRIDLDVSALCSRDPVQCGVRFDASRIVIGDAPGLGVRHIDDLEFLPEEA
jgi:L-alanine-DL-glutamate epimerase-like enolase superfamily enzyme